MGDSGLQLSCRTLAPTRNPLLNQVQSIAALESQMQALPHLTRDQAHTTHRTRRDVRDVRQAQDAASAIGRLPDADTALHLAVSGRFALWHVVPAVLKLTGTRIDELIIATLGFSRRNITALCQMVDAGQIGHVNLLASHYFKGTSGDIYQHAEEQFAARPERAKFLSLRTHAKLLLFALPDGRRLTVESSANLRSCKNIEQMTLIGDPILHTFHRQWILELFDRADTTDAQKQ